MIRTPVSALSLKTCSKTQRWAVREPCDRRSSSARSRSERRQTLLSLTRNGHTSYRPDASCRRGSTTVNHPTSSPSSSTVSSSCAIVRCSRWTRTGSSPKPTRLGGGFGGRCTQRALLRCRAARASGDALLSAAHQSFGSVEERFDLTFEPRTGRRVAHLGTEHDAALLVDQRRGRRSRHAVLLFRPCPIALGRNEADAHRGQQR